MYISIFHREEFTEKALRLLTLQDLEFLGVASFVHRVLIHNSLNDGRINFLFYILSRAVDYLDGWCQIAAVDYTVTLD